MDALYKDDLGVITVPKVASHTVAKVLHDNGWTSKPSGNSFIALIRHPIDRWISGMTQFYHDKPFPDMTAAVNDPVHDIHTEPQVNLHGGTQPKLIKFENMWRLWELLGIKQPDTHIHKHKAGLWDGFKAALTPAYKKRLLNFYADDLALWETAQ